MDSQQRAAEIGEFLASRRARITPEMVGLPVYEVAKRRVPGLRRQEVATLAGLSVDYYTQIERGKVGSVSEPVLDAIARALRLSDAEHAHLNDLVRATRTVRQPKRRPKTRIRPSVQWMLDAMTNAPAIVRNGRMDLLATNRLGRALYCPVYAGDHHANIARFQFLDPAARDFYPSWDDAADITVAIMRTEAGRDPHNRDLTDLIGELATRSEEFSTRWARHNVRLHHHGSKTFIHPAVGELHLAFEAVDLPTPDLWGLSMTVYTAEPATASADALSLLASWAATEDAITADTPDPARQPD